ncbi:protein networked 4a [Anaeramoeba flamelloides]|uniref:Protein networked 4a n=1 Tax=Anaeramoeba flamelloides TaxID=1746091 RepID=A0AAV7Y6Q3_9EUKA|nr:protein networked 4a [Anaeramoeba flamelloides]
MNPNQKQSEYEKQMEERMKKLDQERDEMIKVRKQMEERRNVMENELDEMKDELKEMKNELDVLYDELDDLEMKIEEIEEEEEEKEKEKEKESKLTKKEAKELKKMKNNLNRLKRKISRKENQIDKQNQQIDKQNVQIKEQNLQIDKQNEQIEKQDQKIKEQNTLIKEQKNRIDQQQGRVNMNALTKKTKDLIIVKVPQNLTQEQKTQEIKKILKCFLKHSKENIKNKKKPPNKLFNEQSLIKTIDEFNEDSIPFVNRKHEIGEIVKGIICDFLRLEDQSGKKITNLTWFGSSGIGKTRLAKTIFYQESFKKEFENQLKKFQDKNNCNQIKNLRQSYTNFLKNNLFIYIDFAKVSLEPWEYVKINIAKSLYYRILFNLSSFQKMEQYSDNLDGQALKTLADNIDSLETIFTNFHDLLFNKKIKKKQQQRQQQKQQQ